jgi:hypothetical protein
MQLRSVRAAFALALLFIVPAAPAQQVAVPDDLEPWIEWVLDSERQLRCPLLWNASARTAQTQRCVWPGRLVLDLDADGGTFEQRWQVFGETWVPLPGSIEHWPRAVRMNGTPAAVVARDGRPQVYVAPGTYTLTGAFQWGNRPESLQIAPESALVDLRLDGRPIPQPERPDGALWLGKRRTVEQREQMDVQAYRLVEDGVPTQLITVIHLRVAGDAREEVLPRVLPDGFVPLGIKSPLAARLEPDGRLRVQVRAGGWEIAIGARGPGVADTLTRPKAEAPWPKEEIWSFVGIDRLRVATVEGAEAIDPTQANVPEHWREYPAFRMPQGATLTIVERSRGLSNADENRLTLRRRLWLDFDHGGFTAVDRIQGSMRRDWRLDSLAPQRVESATSGETTLLVTEGAEGRPGIEVRDPTPDLAATSRIDRSRGALPASGWNARFEQAGGDVYLPPGHRLLAVLGADFARSSWIERWGLWGFFGVLVVSVFAGWFAGPIVGAIAFVALLLTYQESAAYIWLWANVLAAAAVARAVPEGRLRRWARGYRTLSFIVLGLALLPFLWGQLRFALYPQLESAYSGAPFEIPAGATPAAAPAAPPAREMAKSVAAEALDAAVVTGSRVSNVYDTYAPGTLLQAGPGIPEWQYVSHAYGWSGPVEADQTVRFVYIGPFALGLWRIVGCVLLALLLVALIATSYEARPGGAVGRLLERARASARGARTAAVALAFMGIGFFGGTPPAQAAETPDAALLTELKERLTRPPRCAPTCGEVMAARVSIAGDRLAVALEIAALADVAMPVPSAADRWQLDAVTLDGATALTVARESDTTLKVPLTQGAHTVRLSGRVAPTESIQLAFPAPPRFVTVESDGWDVAGLNEGRLVSGSLELIRRQRAADGAAPLLTASEFPPFVRVTREIDIGQDWRGHTVIERIAPEAAAIGIEVPLLAGESVLTEGIEVREREAGRVAIVGIERGQSELEWASAFQRLDRMTLSLPAGSQRTEVWRFRVAPQWHAQFEGFPPVLPDLEEEWVFQFHPRPGETLTLNITRPKAVAGRTLAVDSVRHEASVGKRAIDEVLTIEYRSTRGGRHTIVLPESARVNEVTVDADAVQLRPDKGRLSLNLLPGEHSVKVAWSVRADVGAIARPSTVDLATPASNVRTTLTLPYDRWVLLTGGEGVGPVVLYWAELAIFLGMAWLLGGWAFSPLRTHEWLLLGLGLSTFSWWVFVLVAAWLFIMRWREGWNPQMPAWRFNTVQVLLAVLTVVAVTTLIFSGIRGSLLGVPDMSVGGPGSGGNTLSWFVDQIEGALPRPLVFSVPMWVYRALMFAWALWIVLALLRWLRWAWAAWRAHGHWRGDAPVARA